MTAQAQCDVLVAGAGPVGLMLALELHLAGVRTLVVEQRIDLDATPKAEGINIASTEAFQRRGLLDALVSASHRWQPGANTAPGQSRPRYAGHFGGIQVPAGDVDEDDPVLCGRRRDGWFLTVPQVELERILGGHLSELGVEIRRGVAVVGFDTDEAGVTVHLDGVDGDMRTGWLVGCDGGRSQIRRLAGFDFVGTDPEITGRQGVFVIEGTDDLQQGWQHTSTGLYVCGPTPGRMRTIEFDSPPADRDAPVTAAEMESSMRRVSGVDVRITDIISAARFTDNARQATTYRRGRVLLCGDAAHVHSPFSGQGLNLGLGDAANLGWKLAATVAGWAPDGLLDTYTRERHPIGAQILDWTRAQVAVMRGDDASRALRRVVSDFLHTRAGATYYVKRISGLGYRYDLGDDHPLVGTPIRPLGDRQDTMSTLFDFAGDEGFNELAERYSGRLKLVRADFDGQGVSALLVRPDGFVAWASDGRADISALKDALTRWLGQPA